ncbi:MAG: hypothetical protein GHCLOJNM_01110 [bacterium]|nr:hypothetical protein [bacterium]
MVGIGVLLSGLLLAGVEVSPPPDAARSLYAHWPGGPTCDTAPFPIGVWLQDPRDAKAYKAAGINLYVGLWEGPTLAQLNQLKLAQMPVICPQNEMGLRYADKSTIVGWLHRDEPDNAQPRPGGLGHGSPIPPEEILREYQSMKSADPSRPILLNLGQGVAWDGWWGRGERSGHPEDYIEYAKGCDIASFDIYPVAHSHPVVQGKLAYVARGVKRLREWAGPDRLVWNVIETTGVKTGNRPTPKQVEAEVWMSIIHGSSGIIYFVHEWEPKFSSSALLRNSEMLAAVTALNKQIQELAPVLRSTVPPPTVEVRSNPAGAEVSRLVKVHQESVYVFAVEMNGERAEASFTLEGVPEGSAVEVLGEGKSLEVAGQSWKDAFEPYAVHRYRIRRN